MSNPQGGMRHRHWRGSGSQNSRETTIMPSVVLYLFYSPRPSYSNPSNMRKPVDLELDSHKLQLHLIPAEGANGPSPYAGRPLFSVSVKKMTMRQSFLTKSSASSSRA